MTAVTDETSLPVVPFVPHRDPTVALASAEAGSAMLGSAVLGPSMSVMTPGATSQGAAHARRTIRFDEAGMSSAFPSGTERSDIVQSDIVQSDIGQSNIVQSAVPYGHTLLEFGPLAPYLTSDTVTDVFINGTAGLWVDDGGLMTRQESWHTDERSLRELAVRLIALGGRHIDETNPCVDVRLRDGMRVHAVLAPVSTSGTLLSIRVPRMLRYRLGELSTLGTLSTAQLDRVRTAVDDRVNLLITGAGGSGKTTLLSAILAEAPSDERIVTIEDVAELHVRHPHVVALEARQANLEGAGEIGMARLVREALRMRPDRLVVGECRGAEIRDLLAALNTGHDGGAGTLHANSLADVPTRMEALGALAGMTQSAIARQTVSAIGLVLHLTRRDGVRRLAHIGRFRIDEHGQLAIEEETGPDPRMAQGQTKEDSGWQSE